MNDFELTMPDLDIFLTDKKRYLYDENSVYPYKWFYVIV